jgi:rhamnose transport system permease protein
MTTQANRPQAQPVKIEAQQRSFAETFMRWEWLLVVLIIVVAVINSFLSPFFLNANNLFRTSSDFIELGLMMLPMVFIIISGNIDLAVASTLAMTASFMGWLFNMGVNIWVAAAAALVLGGLAGLLNGYLIAKVRLPALVVTLGTFAFYRGMAFVLLGDQAARGYPPAFTYLGQGKIIGPVPFSLVIFLVLVVIFGLVLHKTTFGRYVYAIGNNENACRYSGVPVDRIKLTIFVASGLMSALAGIVMASRFGSTRPDIAMGLELDVITATVLGGIDIFGGSGTMIGAVLSLILIGIMRFGMSLMNIQGQVQSIAIGLLLILAIFLPNVGRKASTGGFKFNISFITTAAVGILMAFLFTFFFTWSRAPVLVTPTPTQLPPTPTPQPAVVLQPTPTPAQIPPTPTPRPSPTPTQTPTAAPTVDPELAESSEPTPTPTATEPPKPIDDMLLIEAGPFTLGSDSTEANESPAQVIELDTFEMDRFEVTNADFAMFVNATGYQTEAEQNEARKTWQTYAADKDFHPVVKVSWADAVAYCEWLDKRLPTEFEWEKAARGPDGNNFPWGNSFDPAIANIKATGIRGTVVVGSFPAGASGYGVEDMAGNVWEWTASPYQAYPNSTYQDQFYSDDLRVTRGGGWFEDEAQIRSTNRSAAALDAANDDLGFRCVRDSQGQ